MSIRSDDNKSGELNGQARKPTRHLNLELTKSKRFYAHLDILGFSKLISEQDFGERFAQFANYAMRHVKFIGPDIEYVLFSDTISVLTPSDSEKDFWNITEIVSSLQYEYMVRMNLPIRGAITCGDITYAKTYWGDTNISGIPVIQAYLREQSQNWVGVVLDPETEKRYPYANVCDYPERRSEDKSQDCYANIYRRLKLHKYSEVPLQDGTQIEAYVIVPKQINSYTTHHLLEDLTTYLNDLSNQALSIDDPAVSSKYMSAISCVESVICDWENRIDSDPVKRSSFELQRHERVSLEKGDYVEYGPELVLKLRDSHPAIDEDTHT